MNGTTAKEDGTLYNIGAGPLFTKAYKTATQTNSQDAHRIHFAQKEEDVPMGSAMAKPLTLHECVQSGTCAVAASRHRTASCATGCTCEIAICTKSAPLAAQRLMQPRLADCRVSSCLCIIVYIVWGLQRSASKAHLDLRCESIRAGAAAAATRARSRWSRCLRWSDVRHAAW